MEAAALPSCQAHLAGLHDGGGEGAAALSPPLPFGDTENPVMAQAAFLAAVVAPPVAAAAAQRALQVRPPDLAHKAGASLTPWGAPLLLHNAGSMELSCPPPVCMPCRQPRIWKLA